MPDQLAQRTYTIGEALVAVDADGTTLHIPPDPTNADYRRALADLGRNHASVAGEIAGARAARAANEDDARTKRKADDRKTRQAVKDWLRATGGPSLTQLATALGSVLDDTP